MLPSFTNGSVLLSQFLDIKQHHVHISKSVSVFGWIYNLIICISQRFPYKRNIKKHSSAVSCILSWAAVGGCCWIVDPSGFRWNTGKYTAYRQAGRQGPVLLCVGDIMGVVDKQTEREWKTGNKGERKGKKEKAREKRTNLQINKIN